MKKSMLTDLHSRFSVAALAALKIDDDFAQILLAEIGPHDRHEEELGIGHLPQQEIADTAFAASSDEYIRIGYIAVVQMFRNGIGLDILHL